MTNVCRHGNTRQFHILPFLPAQAPLSFPSLPPLHHTFYSTELSAVSPWCLFILYLNLLLKYFLLYELIYLRDPNSSLMIQLLDSMLCKVSLDLHYSSQEGRFDFSPWLPTFLTVVLLHSNHGICDTFLDGCIVYSYQKHSKVQ